MADTKTSALTAATTVDPADLVMTVDVSDTSMAASGTNKKATREQLQTYAAGTLTTDKKVADFSATWNNGAVAFTGVKVAITDTASDAASAIADLQVGGSSKFKVGKDGAVTAAAGVSGTTLTSTVSTGTAPLTVASTTAVTNLNADLLDGNHAAAFVTSASLGTGVGTALAVNTGSAGAFVVNGGALGTPSSGTLTNATGLPVSTGVSGLGTGVATALAVNTGSSGAVVVNGGALGTPSSGTVTNLTGTASININGTVGATTANTGAFTTLSASGVATFSAGTASAPAITTSGDTNNGIYFPAADNVAITTGGTQRVLVDSSGNVGIANGSPGRRLTVQTPTATATLNSTAAVFSDFTNATMELRQSTTENSWYSNTAMAFATNNGEKVRIDTSGNVGIGTSSPSSKVEVVGTGATIAKVTNTLTSVSDSAQVQCVSNDIEVALTAYKSGGIGQVGTNSNHPFLFRTNSVERMRIDSSGNVGIGTSSPGAYLHTSGTVGKQAIFAQTSTGTNYIAFSSNGTDRSYIGHDNSSGTGLFGTGTAYGMCIGSPTSIPIGFFTNNAERMRLDTSGNLLLGTTSTNSYNVTGAHIYGSGNAPLLLRHTGATSGRRWEVGPGSDNVFIIYNQDGSGVYLTNGGTSWNANSDERIKDIIEPISNAAEKVCSLRAVIGKYKKDEDGVRRSFLIAQDVQKVLPEAVNAQNDEIGTLGLAYTDTIPLLVAAIQEQQQQIDALKAEVATLKGNA